MKKGLVLICLTVMFNGSNAQVKDASDGIFIDSIVNSFELKYYISNWADTMAFNKEKAGEAYMPAKFIYRGPKGDSIVLDSIGVRYKGNSSYENAKETPKKSFKLSFDQYRKTQTFFDCEKFNLNNNVLDPSQIREKISYDIARKYMPTPRAVFATLMVEGKLIGLYTQVEQVDELFLKRNYAKPSGNLYKAGDNGAVLEYKDINQKLYEGSYELKTNNKDNDWSGFINMLYKLNSSVDARFVETVRNYLDLENCMKYIAWTIALSNFDSYTGSGRNYYMYDDPNSGRFNIIPWDNNMSFGLYTYGWDMISNSPVGILNKDQRPLVKRILENDSLKAVYLAYLQQMINGPISDSAIAAEADRLFKIIDSAVKSEPKDNAFFSYDQFLKNIDSDVDYLDITQTETKAYGIKSFPVERNQELAKQIEAGVVFGRHDARPAAKRVGAVYNRIAGMVTVKLTGFSAATSLNVSMYDGRGRLVRSTTTSSGTVVSLKTVNLVPGIYSIVATTGNVSLSDRVVITQ